MTQGLLIFLKVGDTTGVFQLEGQGMKETLKKFFPIDLKI